MSERNFVEERPSNLIKKRALQDLWIILLATLIPVAVYLMFGKRLMVWGKNENHSLFLRLLLISLIQFGLAGLGMTIVMLLRRERFSQYGLVRRNAIASCLGCLLACIPAVVFMACHGEIHGFLPFGGMFLTRTVLSAPIPFNILGYLYIAVIWGFFEGINYVVICQKINTCYPVKRWFINWGAAVCAIAAILIHGMIGLDLYTVLEAATTFILIYGMLLTQERTGNAWGCILIFFAVWNAF